MLQRLVASHDEIDTIAEPWVMIPFMLPLEVRIAYSEFGQATMNQAFVNILDVLPEGLSDYYAFVRTSAVALYEKMAANNVRYFVDKTPRYHLIAERIIEAFPDAKFIFLWRNPLSVAASIFTMTSEHGTWRDFHRYKVDLYKGFDRLWRSFDKYHERCLSLKYEDIVAQPEIALTRLGDYLDVHFSAGAVDDFSSFSLRGNLGDTKGTCYEGISTQSLGKWKDILCAPARKRWAAGYLQWLGEKRLSQIGYDLSGLTIELEAITPALRDAIRDEGEYLFYRILYAVLDPTIIKYKIHQIRTGERTYPLY